MTLPSRRTAAYLALATALAVGGCSSSGKKSTSSAPAAGTSSPAGPSSSAAATTPAGAPSTGGSPADAATTKAVSQAYKVFFDTKTPLGASIAALQHGPTFKKTLQAESNSPSAQNITAKVSAVQTQGANVAYVTFSLLSGGSPLLPNTHGYAVREGGTWKVAAQTFCNLLKLEGTAPPACDDASITALPN